VARYDDVVWRRLRVKPGLTGLWQVSGRSELSWAESIRLDISYVDNWSPALDARILLRTAAAVIKGTGAY
jgi:lipopolysaccharide/colanic/teichoic acid biosynthesis glycosyltransferase